MYVIIVTCSQLLLLQPDCGTGDCISLTTVVMMMQSCSANQYDALVSQFEALKLEVKDTFVNLQDQVSR